MNDDHCQGITKKGNPCKSPAVFGSDYCRAHQEQRPLERLPVTGGDSPAVERFRELRADQQAGKGFQLAGNEDALAMLRNIMLGVQTTSQEIQSFKARVDRMEEISRQQQEENERFRKHMEARLDEHSPEEKERARVKFALGVQEQVRGGNLEQRMEKMVAREEILRAPRSPLPWYGPNQIFGIADFRILLTAGNNDPCIVLDKKGQMQTGSLPGGVPAPFLEVIREAQAYGEAGREREGILSMRSAGQFKDRGAISVAQQQIALDRKYNIATGSGSTQLLERLATLPT